MSRCSQWENNPRPRRIETFWTRGVVFKILFILFLDGGKREKEREGNINVWFPHVHLLLETWPATQICALTGDRTSNTLISRLVLSPLSHISQGKVCCFKIYIPMSFSFPCVSGQRRRVLDLRTQRYFLG